MKAFKVILINTFGWSNWTFNWLSVSISKILKISNWLLLNHSNYWQVWNYFKSFHPSFLPFDSVHFSSNFILEEESWEPKTLSDLKPSWDWVTLCSVTSYPVYFRASEVTSEHSLLNPEFSKTPDCCLHNKCIKYTADWRIKTWLSSRQGILQNQCF